MALDRVPTGSQDGTSTGKSISQTDILLPPAARAELIVTGPTAREVNATLMTLNIDTGPDGDNDPTRPIAAIETSEIAPDPFLSVPQVSAPQQVGCFAALDREKPSAKRKLYFSEVLSDPTDPNSPTNFYITVDGQTPTLFDPKNPPSIVTTQGAVEDWIIENRALENHEFHIHQIHFLLLDGSGEGPYPSVKLRMDFRGPLMGDFVYHCHILGHEDSGMMATIRVIPPSEHD